MKILVKLPNNRRVQGVLEVVDDTGEVLFSCPCLGRADQARADKAGNHERDPKKKDGDTPLGKYRAVVEPAFPSTPNNLRSYGPYRTIKLTGVEGDALEAMKLRSGLRVHAGDDGPGGALRPTEGCIRLHNQDQANLILTIGANFDGTLEVVSK